MLKICLLISGTITLYHIVLITQQNKSSTVELHCELTKYSEKECGVHNNPDIELEDLPIQIKHRELVNAMESRGLNGLYRPRSALARALYEKQHNDRQLQEFDKNEWYKVEKTRLSEDLQQKFVQLGPDEETKEFLSASIDKSTWVWTQIWYLLAKAVLKHFWSITDINGWLGRGSMFVLSEAQASALLNAGKCSIRKDGSLVDVGAGDGEVSRRFAHLYGTKYATEISVSMRKMLATKGYSILDTEEWWRGSQFDCICMLNLLDRCSKPRSMLAAARAALRPAGSLVLALVLPYKPYVEVTADHKPEERLPIQGPTFEEQVESFVKFMADSGFELASWSRAPYLCEGDFSQAYYWLDDSVYVFTRKNMEPNVED